MYISWICNDLGGVRLYAGELIDNPDAVASSYMSIVQMADRLTSYNIVDHFGHELSEAIATGTDYNSGIIKLARIYSNGQLNNFYLQFTAGYTASTDTVYFRYGNGDGTTWNRYDTLSYTSTEYMAMPLDKRCVSFAYRYRRSNYRYDDMPSEFISTDYFYIWGPVDKLAGHYEEPTLPSYPYGRVVYQIVGEGLISDIPGGATYAAADNAASRASQSQLAADLKNGTEYAASTTDFYFCADDGSHDEESPVEPDPNAEDPGGPSGPGGGDGDHRPTYTPIPIPGLPTIGPNSAGFVFMLRLTTAQMQLFAEDLIYPTWWTALKNFFADPLDFICGIMIVPYSPDSNYDVYPKFGDNIFGHAYPYVTQQYKKIDCGELEVSKYFGGSFDQNPYTKLLVWLPYIGYRELDADECMGKRLHIVYHCDCLTGDCVAYISTIAGSGYDVPFERVVAQFSGNCGVRVPFGSTSFDAAIGASIQLLGGAVGAIAKGSLGAAGITAGAITESQIANSIAGSTAEAVQGLKVSTERSGTAGASAGYLSIQYPYLLRTIPRQSLPTNYKDLEGYPCNIAGPLSGYTGYAAIETINLNGIQASKAELDEIRSLLRGGVYI